MWQTTNRDEQPCSPGRSAMPTSEMLGWKETLKQQTGLLHLTNLESPDSPEPSESEHGPDSS